MIAKQRLAGLANIFCSVVKLEYDITLKLTAAFATKVSNGKADGK